MTFSRPCNAYCCSCMISHNQYKETTVAAFPLSLAQAETIFQHPAPPRSLGVAVWPHTCQWNMSPSDLRNLCLVCLSLVLDSLSFPHLASWGADAQSSPASQLLVQRAPSLGFWWLAGAELPTELKSLSRTVTWETNSVFFTPLDFESFFLAAA